MEFDLTENAARVFAAAITASGKIGATVSLEASAEGVILRTLNSAATAFLALYFSKVFFERYFFPRDCETFFCAMPAKSLLRVLRNMKNVRQLSMMVRKDDTTSLLLVTLHTKTGICRIHALTFEEVQSDEALFDREKALHTISAKTGSMLRLLEHIRGEEVVIDAGPDVIEFRSHHGDEHRAEGGGGDRGKEDGDLEGDGGVKPRQSYVATAIQATPRDFDAYHLNAEEAERLSFENSMASVVRGPRQLGYGDGATVTIPRQPWSVECTIALQPLLAVLKFTDSGAVKAEEISFYFNGRKLPFLATTRGHSSGIVGGFYVDLVLATVDNAEYNVSQAIEPSAATPEAVPDHGHDEDNHQDDDEEDEEEQALHRRKELFRPRPESVDPPFYPETAEPQEGSISPLPEQQPKRPRNF